MLRPQDLMRSLITVTVLGLLLTGVVTGIRAWYVHVQASRAVEAANDAILAFDAKFMDLAQAYQGMAVVFEPAERAALQAHFADIHARSLPLMTEIQHGVSGDRSQFRRLFEEGYSDDPAYRTPQSRLAELLSELDAIAANCRQRAEVRNEVVRNEFILRCRLKKPILSSSIELPAELAEVAASVPSLVALIPREEQRAQLESLGEPVLVNNLGATLLQAKPILEDIRSIARDARVIRVSEGFYARAVARFKEVKPLNDAIPWYRPARDDGAFDGAAFDRQVAGQRAAIAAMSDGDRALDQLRSYQAEVREQVVEWVSANRSESTTFQHSEQVESGEVDKQGFPKYRTRYFDTPGMLFFVERSVNTGSGIMTTQERVGSKDSNDHFGGSWSTGWQEWSYRAEERSGYLIRYKPFGKDSTAIERGGSYQPERHRIFDPQRVPVDAINR